MESLCYQEFCPHAGAPAWACLWCDGHMRASGRTPVKKVSHRMGCTVVTTERNGVTESLIVKGELTTPRAVYTHATRKGCAVRTHKPAKSHG